MHLTVRMAWHDNNWNGTVCQDPKKNVYCIGNNSLLSDRLRRKRNLEIETQHAGEKIDQIDKYLPPCYWVSNAFSAYAASIWHDHPWSPIEPILGNLPSYSVFTWPFSISFTDHDEYKTWGKYPPENIINERLKKLEDMLTTGDSLVFFYLNYSNPISDDEGRYVLVGCAPLTEISQTGKFNLTDKDLQKDGSKEYRHLSNLNWAIQVSYDFKENGVLLPYKEYLDHIDKNPSDYCMLDEIQVLIDEDMKANFKYVAMSMNDDVGIYLLTMLKKSLSKIKEHGIVSDASKIDMQQQRVEHLLQMAWEKRGVYPGLGNVIDVVSEVKEEDYVGHEIVRLVKTKSGSDDILDKIFSILLGTTDIPDYLKEYRILGDIKINIAEDYNIDLLKKLSLFSLTTTQIKYILFDMKITPKEIVSNPYILYEEYPLKQASYSKDKISVDDNIIPLFMIDIGMFPDSKFLDRDQELQNLKDNAPQRIRAIIRDYLKSLEADGDCFAPLEEIIKYIDRHPLYHKEKIYIDSKKFLSKNNKYENHFKEKLIIKNIDNSVYFYLKEIYDAEQRLSKSLRTMLERPDYEFNSDIDLTDDVAELSGKIENFPKDTFVKERQNLIYGVLTKPLYVVTGIPGSGKTKALEKIINKLESTKENVTLLAPTGKAALRLGNGAKTVDRWIHECKWGDILEDPKKDTTKKERPVGIMNLIIDEASMLDLKKLDVLIRMITDLQGKIVVKRIVFVGDPNQLPPIGYGRPFHDIIKWIKGESSGSNYMQLQVNCRHDSSEILEIASIFEYGKDDYDPGRLSRIASGDYSKSGFEAVLWQDSTDLEEKIASKLNDIYGKSPQRLPGKAYELNQLFGLDKNGYVLKRDPSTMSLDNFQILCPYRSRGFGTTAHLNYFIQSEYRDIQYYGSSKRGYKRTSFYHSDKIISTTNKKDLILANGSIGLINIDKNHPNNKRIYFSDNIISSPFDYLPGDVEEYELAYAITIHKSQGSEFKHTFVVIPQKRALLSKELMYTALTRATKNVTLFVQDVNNNNEDINILDYARRRSDIRNRRTSVFSEPSASFNKIFEPKKGTYVRSKIEYILYNKLKSAGIKFEYEKKLRCLAYKQSNYIEIAPDFTVDIGGTEYYLEHLGMLDDDRYKERWKLKRKTYEFNGLADRLITTDDLHGIQDECVDKLLEDIIHQKLVATRSNPYSLHHYKTYV